MKPFKRTARQDGGIKVLLLIALVAFPLIAYGAFSYVCPCDRTPGGYLFGSRVSEPVSDWSFANQVPLCQLEIPALLPYSINLNCMSSGGQLYVSCSACAGKRWSSIVQSSPDGRIRLDRSVYPVTITRVEDPSLLDQIWQARGQKIGRDQGEPRPDGWWSFHLVSR
jgi:hypothetical protein